LHSRRGFRAEILRENGCEEILRMTDRILPVILSGAKNLADRRRDEAFG
jgi:hypothetical protein